MFYWFVLYLLTFLFVWFCVICLFCGVLFMCFVLILICVCGWFMVAYLLIGWFKLWVCCGWLFSCGDYVLALYVCFRGRLVVVGILFVCGFVCFIFEYGWDDCLIVVWLVDYEVDVVVLWWFLIVLFLLCVWFCFWMLLLNLDWLLLWASCCFD